MPDADTAFAKATAFAGVKVEMPVADQFWGDRGGSLLSPNGISYFVATHTEDLTDEQITERAKASMPV